MATVEDRNDHQYHKGPENRPPCWEDFMIVRVGQRHISDTHCSQLDRSKSKQRANGDALQWIMEANHLHRVHTPPNVQSVEATFETSMECIYQRT